MQSNKKIEAIKILRALYWPLVLVLIMWIVFWYQQFFPDRLIHLGVYPLKKEALLGIVIFPFIHGSLNHIIGNSIPFLVLGWCLFYFYREVAIKVLVLILLMSGIWLWLAARPSWHIGASGMIYGMVAFVFVSGVIRRNIQLLAISLMVTFLYGSLIWGIFPIDMRISWEGHLWGSVAGAILAVYYRKIGKQREVHFWDESENDDDSVENPPNIEDDIKPPKGNIYYHYKESDNPKVSKDKGD